MQSAVTKALRAAAGDRAAPRRAQRTLTRAFHTLRERRDVVAVSFMEQTRWRRWSRTRAGSAATAENGTDSTANTAAASDASTRHTPATGTPRQPPSSPSAQRGDKRAADAANTLAQSTAEEAAASSVKVYQPGDKRPGAAGFFRGLFGGTQAAVEDTIAAEARRRGEPVPQFPPRARRPAAAAAASATSASTRERQLAVVAPLARRERPTADEQTAEGDTIRNWIYSRFAGSPFMQSVFRAKERVSDRLDESDHPVVNLFRTMYDRFFAENEMAQVVREIRTVDRSFTVSRFVADMETRIIPAVLRAYLEGAADKLQPFCTEDAFAVMQASIRERRQAGVVMDARLLDLDHVEVAAARFLEDTPVLIVQFATQQIHCLRNLRGEIVEGAEDDIRAVYYVWAMSQHLPEPPEQEAEKQHASRPEWRVMEMVIRGAHATV